MGLLRRIVNSGDWELTWRTGLLEFEVITSIAVTEEFERKSSKKSLQKYFDSEAQRIDLVTTMTRSMIYVEIESIVCDSKDDDDNKFLELALDGEAVVIVSGDPDLELLSPWRNVAILGTGDFVRRFATSTLPHQKWRS